MLKRALLVTVLLAPFSLAAQDASCSHEQKLASCADGYTWDKETGTCVEQVMG
ncbi:hypothetical protein [Celeribacter sp. PS-C1]|uniref:hypothetical protein n=1 Tax=Celeribacter sp. PS-C1 TaxID=2820813 RepID=UPI001CA47163|nr:hypothetical protein [Celeribacter sp. PS-C1]MBW6417745.1 hypothetical protein [Celeribacter sp. PS-C1]